MPDHQLSFQRDGGEIARFWFNPAWNRPFIFPVIGPAGRSLTRRDHPHHPDRFDNSGGEASALNVNAWTANTGKVLMKERRRRAAPAHQRVAAAR